MQLLSIAINAINLRLLYYIAIFAMSTLLLLISQNILKIIAK